MDSHVFIYDQIGEGFMGSGVTLKDVQAQLQKGAEKIIVHINSPGGDVVEGFAIHDFLKNQSSEVTTIIEGKCYSIATVIALAGSERLMQPNAELMIHNPWGAVEGDAEEIAKYSKWVKESENKLINFYSSNINLMSDEIAKLMKETTFMNADQAQKLGFITGKVQAMKAVAYIDKNKAKKMKELTEEQKSWFSKQFEELKALFGKNGIAIKNMLTVEVETEGGAIPIYVDTEDGEIEGKAAYLDEAMTRPAPEGRHSLRDGREITVNAEGVIDSVREEVKDMEDDKPKDENGMEELKAEIAAMKEEMAAMKEEKKAMEDDKEKMAQALQAKQTDFEKIYAQFTEMQNLIVGESEPEKPAKEQKLPESTEGSLFGLGVKSILNKN